MMNHEKTNAAHTNPDAITGAPGSHPGATAIGSASGAATGAVLGAIGGPVGAVIGGVVGAAVGGGVGHSTGEANDPSVGNTIDPDAAVLATPRPVVITDRVD